MYLNKNVSATAYSWLMMIMMRFDGYVYRHLDRVWDLLLEHVGHPPLDEHWVGPVNGHRDWTHHRHSNWYGHVPLHGVRHVLEYGHTVWHGAGDLHLDGQWHHPLHRVGDGLLHVDRVGLHHVNGVRLELVLLDMVRELFIDGVGLVYRLLHGVVNETCNLHRIRLDHVDGDGTVYGHSDGVGNLLGYVDRVWNLNLLG